MNHKDKMLVAILVTLSLWVFVTGGLAICLTLECAGRGAASAVGEVAGTVAARGRPRTAFLSDEEEGLAIRVWTWMDRTCSGCLDLA